MNAQPKNRMYVLVIAFVLFVAFVTLACDSGPSCGDLWGDTPCADIHPENIILGDKSDIEQAVSDALAGDNPQNVLSGGQP